MMSALAAQGDVPDSSAQTSHSRPKTQSRTTGHEPPAATPRSLAGQNNPWLVAVIVSVATFMEVLDTSIANVSLKHIAGNLSAGIDESTWVLTSYLVANAIILPMAGWASLLIGRKRYYMLCVALFVCSSFLCGLAPNLGMLVVFRILQ